MSTFCLVELRGKVSWDPAELLSSNFGWPTDWPLTRFSEITSYLVPRLFINDGTAVITPGGIDRQYGGVRKRSQKYRGSAFQVGGDHRNLQRGDLLLPRNSEIPPVLVGDSLNGAIVSEGFFALRPAEPQSGGFLWALMASRSGQTLRRLMSSGYRGVSVAKLDGAMVPWPSRETRVWIQSNLLDILEKRENVEVEAATTWWSTADLRRYSWQLALATPDPDQLRSGVALGGYSSIFRGKKVDRNASVDSYKLGLLPVTNGSVLSGRKRPRWTERTESVMIALPGDVLVAAVGDRSNARVVEEETVIDPGIILVRPIHPEHAVKIAAYLNSRAGQAQRHILLSGVYIPRVSMRDLIEMPIPEDLFEIETMNAPLAPLADELEELLWTI